jgi:tetratricopeptide (TPR) repeat protein
MKKTGVKTNRNQGSSARHKPLQQEVSNKQVYWGLAAVLAATFTVYLPALTNGLLLWDDHVYLWQNPWLKEFDFAKAFSFSTFYMGHYHPLTLLWLHWEYLLFPAGDPAAFGGLSPFWFHLGSLALHLANTALVFILMRSLNERKEWTGAAFCALLFGIHPMHVESVAWAAELKDVLYTLFYLSSLLAYLRYIKNQKASWLLATFVLFILSCLSKAQAITLPAILLLADWFKGRKFSLKILWEKLPFLPISAWFGVLAYRASQSMDVVNTSQHSALMNVLNGCYSYLWYLGKAIVPSNLCAIHPYEYGASTAPPFWFYLFPAAILLIFAAAFINARKDKNFLFGLLFYSITVSIMLKLVPVGDSLVNERYSYVPYFGIFFIAGHLLSKASELKWQKAAITVAFCVSAVFALITIVRISDWKDNNTFWEDVVEKYPDFWRGYYGLGVLYYGNGDVEKAFEYAGLACEKNSPAAPYALRGTIFLEKKKNNELAEADFLKVLSFKEKDSPFNLMSWTNLGIIWFNKGQVQKADSAFARATELNPGDGSLRWFRAMSQAALGDVNKALYLADEARQMGYRVDQAQIDAWRSKIH